jgi:hypothetical protein
LTAREPEAINAARTSRNLFSILGIAPAPPDVWLPRISDPDFLRPEQAVRAQAT